MIFGVCGGYQMLGNSLSDPMGVESGGSIKGMGLLPMDTVFAGNKTRTRVEGSFGQIGGILEKLSGTALEGYEIHMGVSTAAEGAEPLTKIQDTNQDSAAAKLDGNQKGNVYGSYVHSIFDKEQVAERIVEALGEAKGIDTSEMTGVDYQTFKESQYDILAAALREHMDMKQIYAILEQGV